MFRSIPDEFSPARACRVPWWRICQLCKKQFKYEHSWKGWRALDQWPRNWRRVYVCCKHHDKSQARNVFGLYLPPKPIGPPPLYIKGKSVYK